MSKGLEALEIIKNAPTIYVGCASNIYTRYSHECKQIEKELKALEILKEKLNPIGLVTLKPMSQKEFEILKEVLLV